MWSGPELEPAERGKPAGLAPVPARRKALELSSQRNKSSDISMI
jgi:hypothetical protein